MIVGPAASRPAVVAERVVEERNAVLSAAKVRSLLAGRVPEDQLADKARELLDAAVLRRIQANQSVAVAIEDLDPAERERYARMAHGLRRPRHLILLEPPRDDVTDTERGPLDDLRRALDGGEIGLQGFQTALRLGGTALTELKRIVFQPPPRQD